MVKRILAALIVLALAGLGAGSVFRAAGSGTSSESRDRTPLPVVIVPSRTTAQPQHLLPSGVSAYAIDTASGTALYAQNAVTKRPIASITKLVTTYLILSRHKLDEQVTVRDLPTYQEGDETLGLTDGETLRLGDLVRAALIPSDNDAADALAIYDAGTTEAFIPKMNTLMREWGIDDAHFASASGLNDDDNYASAAALAHIAQLAITDPTLRSLVKTPTVTIEDDAGRYYTLNNTNALLDNGLFYGIKTGYTTAAGQCFVGLTTINGHEVMTIVLGSDDRFSDSVTLRNWIEGAWTWQ